MNNAGIVPTCQDGRIGQLACYVPMHSPDAWESAQLAVGWIWTGWSQHCPLGSGLCIASSGPCIASSGCDTEKIRAAFPFIELKIDS